MVILCIWLRINNIPLLDHERLTLYALSDAQRMVRFDFPIFTYHMRSFFFLSILTFFYSSVLSQQIEIYGTTSKGGHGNGAIFKTDGQGNNFEIVADFGSNVTGTSTELLEVDSGIFYAASVNSIWKTNAKTGEVKQLYFFDPINSNEISTLVKGSGNKIYGTTDGSLSDWKSRIYEFDTSHDSLTLMLEFDSTMGILHMQGLGLDHNGNLYGIAQKTQSPNSHIDSSYLFLYNPVTNSIVKLIDSIDPGQGYDFKAPMIRAKNNKLYGTSKLGGLNNAGVLYEFNPADTTYKVLHHFDSNTTWCSNKLVERDSGQFFGLARTIVWKNRIYRHNSVIFHYDSYKDTLNLLHSFKDFIGDNGIVMGKDSVLYGLQRAQVFPGPGLYSYNIDSSNLTFITPKNYNYLEGLRLDGPDKPLILGSDGNLYGCSRESNTNGFISKSFVYKYDPAKNELDEVAPLAFSDIGQSPYGKLLNHSNGKLFGFATTDRYSNNAPHVIFSFDPATRALEQEISIYTYAMGELIEGSGGLIHFVSNAKIYTFDPKTRTILNTLSFNSTQGYPVSIMRTSKGKYFGVSQGGQGGGNIFEFNPTTFQAVVRYNFQLGQYSDRPKGILTENRDGKLYGLFGSQYNEPSYGSIISFDPALNTVAVLHTFKGYTAGDGDVRRLINGPGDVLYGLTSRGVIFSYDPKSQNYKVRHVLDNEKIGQSYGDLLWASNDLMYGATYAGSTFNYGSVFEYDPKTDSVKLKYAFRASSGRNSSGMLTEINGVTRIFNKINFSTPILVSPNPSKGLFEIRSNYNVSTISIYNSFGKKVMDGPKINPKENYGQIDLTGYPNGIYFIEVILNNGDKTTEKIVKVE